MSDLHREEKNLGSCISERHEHQESNKKKRCLLFQNLTILVIPNDSWLLIS